MAALFGICAKSSRLASHNKRELGGYRSYIREMTEYGRHDSLVRRVVANNPAPSPITERAYTLSATAPCVIDPGPAIPEHLEALKAALEGETISHVVVTHSHMDHFTRHPLAEWAGCSIWPPLALPLRRKCAWKPETI